LIDNIFCFPVKGISTRSRFITKWLTENATAKSRSRS